MAHLDDDVAAFVDGQLGADATQAAQRHLQQCDACRLAVAQQRAVKSRVRSGPGPALPPGLLASLSSVPQVASEPESAWSRWRRSPLLGIGTALLGATVAVALVAFWAGSHEPRPGDPVRPPFAEYAATFAGGHTTAAGTMSVAALDDLDAQGWPCHPELAGGLERVDGRWHDEATRTLTLTYSDGEQRLSLFEQPGSLDDDALQGFTARTVGERRVWVRPGAPRVVAWDADGIVFSAVTDVDDERLAAALAALPPPRDPRGPHGRVGDGLARMTSWVSP